MNRDIHAVSGEIERKRRGLLDVTQNLSQQIVHMSHFTKTFYGELSFPERKMADPGADHVLPPPEVATLKVALGGLVQCNQVIAQRLARLVEGLPQYETLYEELKGMAENEATPG